MNKLKKVVATLMAASTVSALGVGAFAATNYTHYDFDLSPSRGSYEFSSAAEKEDNEDSAIVHCESGDVTSTRSLTLAVYKSRVYATSYCISDPETVDDADDQQYTLFYNVSRGAGSTNYLCATAGYYSAGITGHWDP